MGVRVAVLVGVLGLLFALVGSAPAASKPPNSVTRTTVYFTPAAATAVGIVVKEWSVALAARGDAGRTGHALTRARHGRRLHVRLAASIGLPSWSCGLDFRAVHAMAHRSPSTRPPGRDLLPVSRSSVTSNCRALHQLAARWPIGNWLDELWIFPSETLAEADAPASLLDPPVAALRELLE